MIIESRAYARAGLLGNPSDGYFGKTISISVRNFGVNILLYESPELRVEQQGDDLNSFKNVYDMVNKIQVTGYYGAERLIKAAIKVFSDYCDQKNINLNNKNFTIRYGSSIPRQVGLAGSSAIITAVFKALMQFYKVKISKEILPSLILSVEQDELGINAGLQDRVIQVYEGCVYMDFNKEVMKKENHGIYEKIDPQKLPPLYIAYKTSLGKVSGKVFNDISKRYHEGDAFVVDTLKKIADQAEKGKEAIFKNDYTLLHELINENFDLRKSIMNISDSNMELIETARKCGASAKFSGSGGSIIGTYADDDILNRLIIEMKKVDARVIKPYIV
ncbi:GHMP kinase [bacterium]|nr:GHMP kinase [bacterium]